MRREPAGEAPLAHEADPGASAGGAERWRFSRASINLTFAGIAFTALGFVSGPLLARALEPAGRGDLAAILVPLFFAREIGSFGLDVFAAREAARRTPVGTLALSLGAVLIGIGVLVFLIGIPLSSVLADDRSTVHTFLLVAFATLPIVLLGILLVGISTGIERWPPVIAARIVPGVLGVLALVVLFVTDMLTVASAATVYIVIGLMTLLITVPVLRGRLLRFDPAVIKKGLPFGARAVAGTTADLANARLDQLLMITLVSPHQLGLYAVAANISGVGNVISGGISPPLLARISAGEVDLAPRALRTVLSLLAILSLLFALAMPVLLTLLFGSDFADAAPPAWILLAAGLPLAGAEILTGTLQGVGHPGLPSIGQGVALAITVVGLLVLLPSMGIIGAAVVSFAAYSVNFLILLVATARTCEMKISELLIPTGADVVWLRDFVRSRIRNRGRGEGAPGSRPSARGPESLE
jgi:O-antigen/teichoic acid export membrane protein